MHLKMKGNDFDIGNENYKEVYNNYLKSSDWNEKRLMVLKRDNYLCQACLTREATQVHHKTYDRIFHEPLFDLESVCDKCHEDIHKKYSIFNAMKKYEPSVDESQDPLLELLSKLSKKLDTDEKP